MKGFVEEPNKGTLEYTGCNNRYIRNCNHRSPTRAVLTHLYFAHVYIARAGATGS